MFLRKVKGYGDSQQGGGKMNGVKGREELISVIIPVYNKEKYLCKCLDSVLAQTYGNIEVLLVDDASSDKSRDICDEYAKKDRRISVVHLEENRGVSHARNVGLDRAKGEFFCFVDADDYTKKDMLRRLYDNLKENQADVSICAVDYIGFGAYTDKRLEKNDNIVLSGEEAISCMIKRQFFGWGPCGKIYTRRKAMHCHFHEKVYCGEDILFLCHLFQYTQRVSVFSDKLYCYIYRNDSVTKGGFHKRQYSESLVYEFLCRKLGEKQPELLPLLEQKILAINVRLAVNSVECGEVKGRKLYGYLKRFRRNICRHLNRRSLALFEYRKIAAETVLLYISAEVFWIVLIFYKRLKGCFRKCA